MKRIALIAAITTTLCASTLKTEADGGCYGFWPFFAFGLTVAAIEASSRSYPVYVYEPAYNSAPPPTYTSPPPPQVYNPPPDPEPWRPSTAGAGQWVPEPKPYSYAPAPAVHKPVKPVASSAQTVTVTRTAGGVPLYINSR